MALGKPLIVTKEGGMIEAIDQNGYFISKELNGLKQKIDLCIKNKKSFGAASLQLAKQYDVSKICRNYLKLIK